MRAHGTGTVEQLPSHKFRARLPGRTGKKLPARDSREEAERDLDLANALIQTRGLTTTPQGTPLSSFGRRVIERREIDGLTNARREMSRWATHVEQTELGRLAVETFTRSDVLAWMRSRLSARAKKGNGHTTSNPRPLSRSVVIDALRILRSVVREATLQGLRQDDPTAGVKIPRDRGKTHDPWTWLRPREVERLLSTADAATAERDLGGLPRANGRTNSRKTVALVDAEDRDAALFAILTGVREGEQWTQHTRDIDPVTWRMVVRFGGRNGTTLIPTKGRRPRVVQLLPPAIEVVRRQLARLATRENPRGLLWPSRAANRGGAFRAERSIACWSAWVAAAGLDKGREDPAPVAWHSLRHTFATLALWGKLPGCEGEGWRLERVSAYLGHKSIAITQRYADVAALL